MSYNEYDQDIVISSRVRLARNLFKTPYPTNIYQTEGQTVLKELTKVFESYKQENFDIKKMSDLSQLKRHLLKEQHLISKELLQNTTDGALAINKEKDVAIMINEEDHIRQQCVLKGFKLKQAFEKLDKVDDYLISNLDIDFDYDLGFLTSCLTNLGTGMRTSVMLFLPALSISNKINEMIKQTSQMGVTVRGVYGEGTAGDGFMYQISNQYSLGLSEQDIIKNVENVVYQVIDLEIKQRNRLRSEKMDYLKDIVNRAYGTLTNCYSISSSEYMKLVAYLKFGESVGIIAFKDEINFDELMSIAQPATLIDLKGENLDSNERDLFRAEYINQYLKDTKI